MSDDPLAPHPTRDVRSSAIPKLRNETNRARYSKRHLPTANVSMDRLFTTGKPNESIPLLLSRMRSGYVPENMDRKTPGQRKRAVWELANSWNTMKFFNRKACYHCWRCYYREYDVERRDARREWRHMPVEEEEGGEGCTEESCKYCEGWEGSEEVEGPPEREESWAALVDQAESRWKKGRVGDLIRAGKSERRPSVQSDGSLSGWDLCVSESGDSTDWEEVEIPKQ